MTTATIDLSFIIPVFNEEQRIGSTIESIRSVVGKEISHEIIVIDNGSKDRTVQICQSMGVQPVKSLAGTVGAVRNVGAGLANGTLLVFLDGDVTLLPEWGEHFPSVYKMMHESPMTISGSMVLPDEAISIFSRVWFRKRRNEPGYVNSGHMIIHRNLFKKVAGFNESLVSGEDSDLSRRAAALGAVIKPVPELKAVHHGTPSTFTDFFWRERWHGHGDFQSWSLLLKSKPSHMAILNLAALIAALIGAILISPWMLVTYPAILLGLGSLCALHRTGYHLEGTVLPLTVMCCLYIVARSFSMVDCLLGTRPGRWR